MTERSIGKAGGSNVPQTKEDIARKLADRHPEVSKNQMMSLSKDTLLALMLDPKKFASMFSVRGRQDVHPGTEKKRTLRRRGGGIAKRGFGIAK
tara:strand:+ start:189 stop:470 length:282 start_codon:yes stop_codon:yes gene_type:complete